MRSMAPQPRIILSSKNDCGIKKYSLEKTIPFPIKPIDLHCPKCHGQLLDKKNALVCSVCSNEYNRIEDYYDFFLTDQEIPKTDYPQELSHLLYSPEKILSLTKPKSNLFFDKLFRRYVFLTQWADNLENLKKTIQKYGANEKNRVEFMVDNRLSKDFINQKEITELKAKSIIEYISSLTHTGNKVLHIGCGGECNAAIPIEYQKAGFINFGVDAVRSYVKEFRAFGDAHLANASALPYADEVFDIVNFTDILEHLFDPLKGIQEAARVLKPGGHLVLETPNRAYLSRKNPISWIEYFLGSILPASLRPRIITASWEGEVLFHTEFSKKELFMFFIHSGLIPIKITTETIGKPHSKGLGTALKKSIIHSFEKIAPTNKWISVAQKTVPSK
jgi:SAM-dependent methyltransferase